MRVRILQALGDWRAGTTVDLDDRRAARVIRTGYAVRVDDAVAPPARRGRPRRSAREAA